MGLLITLWISHVLHYSLRPFLDSLKYSHITSPPQKWKLNVLIVGPLLMSCVVPSTLTWMGPISTLVELLLVYAIYSTLFYWIHVAFHSSCFYKWHKQHHSYVKPNHPWAAFDASWVEHAFLNVFPLAFACWIVNATFVTCVIFIMMGTEYSMMAHVGNSEFHYNHHLILFANYGIDSFWDTLCGTKR
jgi:sterol desaturase/sphingolipid hydroxylase (fatty acid hydroxylase superfamily)